MSERRLRLATGALALVGLAVAGYLTYVHYAELEPFCAGRLAGALLALVGFGFSAYLTWIELFEIDAICQWCVVSALLMTGLALTTAWRVLVH